jgi:CheY-like chemotaxis protein
MGPQDTPIVGWLVQKADEVIWGRGHHKLLVVPAGDPARGLQPCFLQQPNLRILSSGDEVEAWQIAVREQPNLIIHDLDGVDVERLDLCRRFKSEPETRSTPMIVIVDPAAREEATQVGADAIIDRPIVQSEYFEAVCRFVPLPRRRQVRHAINVRFSYVVRGRFRQAFSRDLSVYGAFLKTDVVVPEGSHIKVDFHIPGETDEIHCGAVVRRSLPYRPQAQQLAGMAIEFEGIRERDLRRLERFIKRHFQRSVFSR